MKIFQMITKVLLTTSLALLAAKSAYAAEVEFLNSKPSSKSLPFSEAVKVGNTLYLSGQIGFDSKEKKLVSGGLKAEAAQALDNIKASLIKYDYKMQDVVKCMVMLTDINDFKAFNEVYVTYFKPPYPARSAFTVKELAINSIVEIECMAVKTE